MTLRKQLQGVGTALVTPFTKGGRIDYTALRRLIELQIAGGVSFLVTCGTTGESPTVTHAEQRRILKFVLEVVAGRIPVVAGVGSNSTKEAVSLTKHALEAGAAAGLSVTPYYNCPTQEGIYQHFAAIAEVGLPIILYDIPGRCVITIELETLQRLEELENIIGIKEAAGYDRYDVDSAEFGSRLLYFSGDDPLTYKMMFNGADGVISVTSNLFPVEMVALTTAALTRDKDAAQRAHKRLSILWEVLFLEKNPIGIKYMMSQTGLIKPALRLPMVMPTPATVEKLDAALERFHSV